MPSRYCALLFLFACAPSAPAPETRPVGVQPDGKIVVPTNQVLEPAGTQVTFPGRPVDLAFVDEKTLVAKNMRELTFIDIPTGKVRSRLTSPIGFSVVGLLVAPERIWVTDVKDHVRVAEKQADGTWKWGTPLALKTPAKGAAFPAGLMKDGDSLWVASSRGNSVQRIDLATREVKEVVAVGVAPFAMVRVGPDKFYVSNWGGDHPGKSDPKSTTSGTPVRVDTRTGVANHGSVSVLVRIKGEWKQGKTIPVGRHPSGMTASRAGRFLYVANANDDTVSVIDTKKDLVVETILCRPEARLPFGSGCNALALSPDGATLYVANGTNNCVAVIRLGEAVSEGEIARPAKSTLTGLIPVGWYPGAILVSPAGDKLFVANIKGHGSLSQPRPKEKGKNNHDHLGSVSIVDVPGAEKLAAYTRTVNANNRLAYSLAGLEKPRAGVKPVPVPVRHGEPSVFRHVVYVIKENRTYDQVFGGMKEGRGDPDLVMFGENVTPNHHALARQFTLFDNFYCSGVLSADGHSWVNEAYVTDYLERSFGGFTRSYPYEGDDPLAFANTGFLWDNALARKKTFRNFGEFVTTSYTPAKASWKDLYSDYKDGTREVKIAAKANLKSLLPYTHPGYPGFPLKTPDVYRAKMFLDELASWEKKGEMPNLTYVFLPCDHTNGTSPGSPTPNAMVADNDLALGMVVEGISRSKFWGKTCIFVVEDDPQNGFDHIDSHRTVALVISPYTRRKYVDPTNYNQTGMVKTIELILGLPPMNQLDLSATAMRACFGDEPDLTAYKVRPNKIPLDQMNPPIGKLKGAALEWAKKSMAMSFEREDEADEDTLNRILWHATRGDAPYPEAFAGGKKDE
jgi:YVTN family beta-propeller protein